MAGPTTPPAGTRFSTGEDLHLLHGGPTSAPPGAVVVSPGPSTDLGALSDQYPAGTTFYLLPGRHVLGGNNPDIFSQVGPKDGNTYIGAPGAVLDGRMISQYSFTGRAIGVRLAYLEICNFRAPVEQAVTNHDGGENWVIEYCHVHHNQGAGVGVAGGVTLRYCWLHHNGQYGFTAISHMNHDADLPGALNINIHHNEIHNNGDQLDELMADGGPNPTGGGRNGACKFWDCAVVDLTDNWFHHSNAVGLWADTNNIDFRIEDNLFEDNWGPAIFYEISYNPRIANNTFRRNAIPLGLMFNYSPDGFPAGAVYMSEAGSEPRLTQYRYNTVAEVTGNTFINNWHDIALWENPDRFCNSGANTSGKIWKPRGGNATLAVCNAPFEHSITVNLTAGSNVFTVEPPGVLYWNDEGQFIRGTGIPAGTKIEEPTELLEGGWTAFGTGLTGRMTQNATVTGQVVMTFSAGSINTAPAIYDCRWRTQNLSIHANTFDHNQAEVLGTRNTLSPGVVTGRHAVFSNGGYPPVTWYNSPYELQVEDWITFQQNNRWANNTYRGSAYNFMPHDLSQNVTPADWQAAPYNQDASSTFSTTDPVTGFANTSIYRADAPTAVTAVAGDGQAKVSFPPCMDAGGDQVVGYTVTASPGGASASGRGSPIVVTGLTNGTSYTFTVQTRTAIGLSDRVSPASNAVTPATGGSFPTAKPPWHPREIYAVRTVSGDVEVSFLEPPDTGTSPVTSYTVTAYPGGISQTNVTSPVTFPALPDGTYTFTARATSADGSSPDSPPTQPFTFGPGGGSAPGQLVAVASTRTATGAAAVGTWAKTATGLLPAARHASR